MVDGSGVRAFRFPAGLLGDDEDLVVELRPHWIGLARPALQGAVILAAAATAVLFAPYRWGTWAFAAILSAAAVAFVLWPARAVATWLTAEYAVTTGRVIRRSGLVGRTASAIPLERITDVRTRQSAVRRLVGAGDLHIESAGSTGSLTFRDVPHPEAVQRAVLECTRANAAARASRAAGGSVADEITKLMDLRLASVITEEEYDALKSRLIGQT